MFPWLGFSAGPLAARIVADLILGRPPEVDLTAFSAARY
jgi:glycine/D-amino acid oxidase-like deaminating enzyme